MSAIKDLSITCPACGKELIVPVDTVTMRNFAGGTVQVNLVPDMSGVNKHMTEFHQPTVGCNGVHEHETYTLAPDAPHPGLCTQPGERIGRWAHAAF